MKKVVSAILILGILVSGCTHNLGKYSNETHEDFYYRVSKLCEKKNELTIEGLDGKRYKGTDLRITSDSTILKELETNTLIVLKTKEVNTISYTQMGRGIFEGFLFGTSISSGILLASIYFSNGGGHPGISETALIFVPIIGAVVGIVYGLINQSTTNIEIN